MSHNVGPNDFCRYDLSKSIDKVRCFRLLKEGVLWKNCIWTSFDTNSGKDGMNLSLILTSSALSDVSGSLRANQEMDLNMCDVVRAEKEQWSWTCLRNGNVNGSGSVEYVSLCVVSSL